MIINKDFIKEIENEPGICFDESNDKTIIPNNLIHRTLLNTNIDKSIYKYYCFNGLQPYSMVIYGAYHRRNDIVFKLTTILNSSKRTAINGKAIKEFNDLDFYFKEYAQGFEIGFNEFDNDIIKPFLLLLADKGETINKVFEYIVNNWGAPCGFTLSSKNIKANYEIEGAYDDGKKQGYLYKAWSTILANQNHFIPLFNNLAQDAEQPGEPQQSEKPKYKISTKHHVMADIFERNATGRGLPNGSKERKAACKDRAKKCTKQQCAPNTFYKNYNWFTESGTDINKKSDLIKYFDEDWREILLYITTEPEKVKEYLQKHQI